MERNVRSEECLVPGQTEGGEEEEEDDILGGEGEQNYFRDTTMTIVDEKTEAEQGGKSLFVFCVIHCNESQMLEKIQVPS